MVRSWCFLASLVREPGKCAVDEAFHLGISMLGPSETIHVAGEGPRCYPCFNREIAERIGIDYDEPQFQPIVLEDVSRSRDARVCNLAKRPERGRHDRGRPTRHGRLQGVHAGRDHAAALDPEGRA